MADSKRPRLVHRIRVRASAETIWRAITDPAFTEQYYFGLAVRSEWKKGARILYETCGGETFLDGSVVEVTPPRRLRYSVRLVRDAETALDLPSRVTGEIVPTEDGCDLIVVHDEFETETATYRRMGGGWPLALRGLQELLEKGEATLAQSAWPESLARPPSRRRGKKEEQS